MVILWPGNLKMAGFVGKGGGGGGYKQLNNPNVVTAVARSQPPPPKKKKTKQKNPKNPNHSASIHIKEYFNNFIGL